MVGQPQALRDEYLRGSLSASRSPRLSPARRPPCCCQIYEGTDRLNTGSTPERAHVDSLGVPAAQATTDSRVHAFVGFEHHLVRCLQ